MQNSSLPTLNMPSLPSGGGAVTGLKQEMTGAGPDGAASLSIPLSVSTGRGYAPSLALTYHSRAGNGAFGIGWHTSQPAVRRRTRKGAPEYSHADEFCGPDGETLVPVLSADGVVESRSATMLLDTPLTTSFTVTAWRSRTEKDFSRFEYWQASVTGEDFWVIYLTNGEVFLLGRNQPARIANPQAPAQTAVWLIESSVSATGEQIWYQYRAEDEINCSGMETSAHPDASAQRYPVAIFYGNEIPGRQLPGLVAQPLNYQWLFIVVFDYGERATGMADIPSWQTPGTGNWRLRQDCFSDYSYGFEIRTRRLCREVLLFHRLRTLGGAQEENETPELVMRWLIEYAESPTVSRLQTLQQTGYETDGTRQTLPPLVFDWQNFTPPAKPDWQLREDLGMINALQPYQLVDLNGEGLPGILYQDSGAWWYRAPVRKSGGEPDAVTWDKATQLTRIPSLRHGGMLTDLNGDGRLEWVVTVSGVAGQYQRTPQQEWLHFTPLSALPTEYAHPQAQLTDILGDGLVDLVLTGPNSVRIYGGTGSGWQKSTTVIQPDGIALPVPGRDERTAVAFSDMPGSGQQHLVEVSASGVRYWPNLGHGRFGHPVDMPGFSQPAATFNPERLYLADIDGSGTTDLIYTFSDRFDIYLNQNGNSFAAPFRLYLPDGIRYDQLCSLQLADIQGLGIASLIFTVTHPQPRSWVCHLSVEKPWLLSGINNNMGTRHQFHYRSSAQFWLDEKVDAAAAGKAAPVSYLPFALHTLWKTEAIDEITGNRLMSKVRYRHGVWDARERELRGFAYVERQDTDTASARGTAKELALPSLTRNWIASGLPEVDNSLAAEYWQGDRAAFSHFTPRFTQGIDDRALMPDEATVYWLHRGMQGIALRSELYATDKDGMTGVPLLVNEYRPQVRCVEPAGLYPVAWPVVVESRTYTYEGVSSDPQCAQQVLLASDAVGQPLRQLAINYPRRTPSAATPYPDWLPDTLYASSCDQQQFLLRLRLQQASWHQIEDMQKGNRLSGLANAARSDSFTWSIAEVPEFGITLEWLQENDFLFSTAARSVFGGQQQICYLNEQNEETVTSPAFPPRIAYTESAIFDENIVQELADDITSDQLQAAGYQLADRLFPRPGEEAVWCARQGYATYAGAEHYWLPVAYRETQLTGAVKLTRDAYDCVITQVQNAAGLTSEIDYDWRFLSPVRIKDVNDNVQLATLDALGRITTLRFSGTENGRMSGYSDAPLLLPATIEAALTLPAPLPVAQCFLYVADSWMREQNDKLPPHLLTLTTDRYDSDPEQQIRQQVTFSDGFERVLQSATRQIAGEAWARADEGSLIANKTGGPDLVTTDFRWAVSGRTEYDNKGQPVRTYQPYFLNSWKYISDDSARQDLYADTYYYDPVGREYQVLTAKGWLRRTFYTPWFVVSEDENDTAK